MTPIVPPITARDRNAINEACGQILAAAERFTRDFAEMYREPVTQLANELPVALAKLARQAERVAARTNPTCGHCCGPALGYATIAGTRLCHPDVGIDCYQLVTVHRHEMPCARCTAERASEDALDGAAGTRRRRG